MAFPEYLKYWRQQRGLTQEALALLVGLGGQSTIGNYEAGKNEPSYSVLLKLAATLQVPVGALLDASEFQALKAGYPVEQPGLKRVFHDYLMADNKGRYYIETTAAAAAQEAQKPQK